MKKIFAFFLAITLISSLFSGCLKKGEEKTETVISEATGDISEELDKTAEEVRLPFDETLEFYFSSGAGAWGTELYLEKDGSFTGSFHDTNMGETGDENPYGTCYVCNFSGKFEILEKISDTAYKMNLSELDTEKEIDTKWIEDGILYVASTPYGLDGGKEFILYTPETKTESVTEEFLWWWPYRFEETAPLKLGCYGIHNVNTDDGFFTYQ